MFASETAADTRYDLGHQDVFSSCNMYIFYNKNGLLPIRTPNYCLKNADSSSIKFHGGIFHINSAGIQMLSVRTMIGMQIYSMRYQIYMMIALVYCNQYLLYLLLHILVHIQESHFQLVWLYLKFGSASYHHLTHTALERSGPIVFKHSCRGFYAIDPQIWGAPVNDFQVIYVLLYAAMDILPDT